MASGRTTTGSVATADIPSSAATITNEAHSQRWSEPQVLEIGPGMAVAGRWLQAGLQ